MFNHHSHITLYTTQGHLQAVQPTTVTSHYIPLRGIYRLSQPITVTSHYIRLRGICRLFNPPQSHHIIYDLGAFAGCSTLHNHIILFTTQWHLQPVQPTTVTSHYIRLRGICRLFNHHSHITLYTTQGHLQAVSTYHSHITLYTTQGHLQAVQPTTVTSHYIRLQGSHHLRLSCICSQFNPHYIRIRGICSTLHHSQFNQPQSHYIRLRGTCRLFNHHSHTTLYTQGHLQASQPITVTSHYIRLRGICRLFNQPQSHHIIYDLVAFVASSTHHSHITLYMTQGTCRLFNHHSHTTLYTTQGHLQASQPITVTSHYIRLRGICRLFNPPQSHHIIYDLAGICSQFTPPQSHHIIYDLGAFVGCSTLHSHITFNPPQSHHI